MAPNCTALAPALNSQTVDYKIIRRSSSRDQQASPHVNRRHRYKNTVGLTFLIIGPICQEKPLRIFPDLVSNLTPNMRANLLVIKIGQLDIEIVR